MSGVFSELVLLGTWATIYKLERLWTVIIHPYLCLNIHLKVVIIINDFSYLNIEMYLAQT